MLLDILTSEALRNRLRSIGPRLVGFAHRTLSSEADFRAGPPVLGNSIGKSGTHLLLQVLQSLPHVRYFRSLVASTPSRPHVERPVSRQLALLNRIAPREVTPAHLYFHEETAQFLTNRNFVNFFNYRDPRDICISEVHYFLDLGKHHAMHPIMLQNYKCNEERLTVAITGVPENGSTLEFPNIAERIGKFRGWMNRPDVMSVRFEDLRSDRAPDIVARIVKFYCERTNYDFDIGKVASKAVAGIAPERSRTFRSGKTAQWRNIFTDEQKRLMKDVAGNLLIELGYEKDLDW